MKNEEAELSILGAILYDPSLMDKISDIRAEHFTCEDRSAMFSIMSKMHEAGETIDAVTLRSKDNSITKAQINFLADLFYDAGNIIRYAIMVKDCAKRRNLVAACDEAREKAINTESIKEAIDAVESSVLAVRTVTNATAGASVQVVMKKAFADIEKRYNNKGKMTGLSTGFKDIDEMTAGLQKGDFIILAARPSMGKTAMALNIAEEVCKSGKSVQVFSLEMTGSQLVQRSLASVGRVDAQRMRSGNFIDSDWGKLSGANEKIFKWKLQIEDGFNQTLLDIRAAARRQSRTKQGLDFIIIDYLQLINSHDRQQSREQEVAKMSRSLKQLAKELNVPVMVLAQLNRGLEAREDKRPRNSDLRESGSLEQDADVIIFLHRETYFCPECRTLNEDCGKNHYNTAEAIISKQRNGPTGTVNLTWFGEICKFANGTKKEMFK